MTSQSLIHSWNPNCFPGGFHLRTKREQEMWSDEKKTHLFSREGLCLKAQPQQLCQGAQPRLAAVRVVVSAG